MNKYGLVMVLYEPDMKKVDENIKKILKNKKISEVKLVDNSMKKKVIKIKDKRIEYIFLGENKGIAYAQNVGINELLNSDLIGVFLFDQDTVITTLLIDKMIESFEEINNRKLGILVPNYNENSSSLKEEKHFIKVREAISSGSLVKLSLFADVGFMEESLFIDYVDFEFCWRIQKYGYEIIQADNIFMKHYVGEKKITILGKKIYVPAPFRHYYVYRNGKVLIQKDYVPTKWKVRETFLRLLTPLFVVLFMDNKKKRLSYIFRGWLDGYRV